MIEYSKYQKGLKYMRKEFSAFEPVKIQKTETGVCFDVWGRTYEFSNSFVPTKITVLGNEILSSPIKLNAYFEDKKVGNWTNFHYIVHKEDDEQAIVLVSAECENIIANATVTIEFDGFIKIDFRIMNFWSLSTGGEQAARLQGLDMTADFKGEYSNLFHFWPNDKTSIIPSPTVINSGDTETAVYNFKPYIWTGNEKLGLGIFCGESDESFELADEDKCIEVEKKEYTTSIRIHMIDGMPADWADKKEDNWCRTLNPLFFTIGFQATPVKAMPKDKEQFNKIIHFIYDKDGKMKTKPFIEGDAIEKAAKAGAKWVIFHEDWTAIQNYGYPEDVEGFKSAVKKCHKYGLKVMVYFGYEYCSLAPDFNQKANEYLIKIPDGSFTGGWQRQPSQRDFMTCYNGPYSEVMLKKVEYVMDELGVDGIYTDGTYVPWECANEAHGCGYRDKDGKLHATYPILADREHVKKLYSIVHKRGGIVDTHQSACCLMPTLAFADSYFDGENIQGMVRDRKLRLDQFRCEYAGINMGLPCNFVAYTNDSFTMENMLALPAIHNVLPRCSKYGDIEYMGEIWKIFDKYGLHNAEFVPYYENDIITTSDNAYISVYNGKKNIAVVCNLDDSKKEVEIFSKFKTMKSLMSGEAYSFENGKVTIDAPAVTFRIFELS